MKQTVKPFLVPGFKEVVSLDWIVDKSCFNIDKETLTKKLGDSIEDIFQFIDGFDLHEVIQYFVLIDIIISAMVDDEDEYISKVPAEIRDIYLEFYNAIWLYLLDLRGKLIKEAAEQKWDERDFRRRQEKAASELANNYFENKSKPVYNTLEDYLDKDFEKLNKIYQSWASSVSKQIECKKSKRKPTKRHRSITSRPDVTE